MRDSIHDLAAQGFGNESNTYAAARPTYHAQVLDQVVAALPAGLVIDVGAGTGIATAALLARGLDVLAVEPVAGMRATFAERVPGAPVVEGTAESIPQPDGAAAAVTVAQAFHWFDHEPALNEIARVLRPHGVLVTLWNVRDESVPWMAAYTEVQVPIEGDTPRYRDMHWRRAIEADDRFELAGEFDAPNPQPSNAEHTVRRFRSTSFVASLDDEHQARVLAEVRDIVAPLGESFDFPYRCEAQIWKRSGSREPQGC